MFFRFGGAVILLTLIAVAGIAFEKQMLDLRRQISHQSYRREVLLEEYARQRLEAQRLGAPARLLGDLEAELLEAPGGRPPSPSLTPVPTSAKPRSKSKQSATISHQPQDSARPH